jgi:cytochrome c oxidase subunit I+III
VHVLYSIRYGREASEDPWGGDTLEWSLPSPPAYALYARIPVVASRHPLWDREARSDDDQLHQIVDVLDHQPIGWRATLLVDAITGEPQAIARLATPSYMPFVAALGIVLLTVATIAKLFLLIPVGLAISVAAVGVWLWPDRKELERMRTSHLMEATGLPVFTTGKQSLGWLGLLFLMAVLGWCVGTLLYTYFYLRLYSSEWPQENLPLPGWLTPLLYFATLPLSAACGGFAWRSFRKEQRVLAIWLLAVASVFDLAFLSLHIWDETTLTFSPQTNAYGSVFYLLSWALDVLAGISLGLTATALIRLWREREHWQLFNALHTQMAAHFGYFAAAMALIIFAALYLSPHVL